MSGIPDDIRETAKEISEALIPSMCVTMDHSFGLQSEKEQRGLRLQMSQVAKHDVALAIAKAILAERQRDQWQDISTVPDNETVILANFNAMCLLTGAPHVWTATYVTRWETLSGEASDDEAMWCECSYAATNENGEPTHWMPLPPAPKGGE